MVKLPAARTQPRGNICHSRDAKMAEFTPFGPNYRGGVSLATGWLYGQYGGAKRIIVSQLADAGAVKIYSTGSALEAGPALELQSPVEHGELPTFDEVYSFEPFDGAGGVRVATTSTTTGANLLVSGVPNADKSAKVLKFDFVRPTEDASTVIAKKLGEVYQASGSAALLVGGD